MKFVLPLFLLAFVVSATSVSAQTATSSATSSATTTTTTTSSSSTTASTSTTAKGGTVTMPEELPQTGGLNTTFAIIILGSLSIGVGLYTHYALPIVLEKE